MPILASGARPCGCMPAVPPCCAPSLVSSRFLRPLRSIRPLKRCADRWPQPAVHPRCGCLGCGIAKLRLQGCDQIVQAIEALLHATADVLDPSMPGLGWASSWLLEDNPDKK